MLVDKDGGWTSHDVVAKARGLLATRKIGHAGTLDPMATGLLVLGIGSATRLLRFVTDQPKEYRAVARFGVATDTLDAEGEVLHRDPIDIGEEEVEAAMAGFVGEILQTPPMVSAIKVGGRRLHELARRGEEVKRLPRSVRVDSLEMERFEPGPFPHVSFRVVGGSGLYVRVLADDVARALGSRAHLTALRRVRNGPLLVEAAHRVDRLVGLRREGRLVEAFLSSSAGLSHLPQVEVRNGYVKAVRNGRHLPVDAVDSHRGDGLLRMMSGGYLLAVYRAKADKLLSEVVLP